MGYFFLLLGWIIGDRLIVKPFYFRLSPKSVEKIVIIGLVFGIMAYFAYVNAMGGIWDSLLYGSAIRYGRIDLETFSIGRTEVLRYFVSSLNMVFLYYLARVFARLPIRGWNRIFFLSSGFFLMLYFLSISSRGAFVGLIMASVVILSYHDKDRITHFFRETIKIRSYLWAIPLIILIVIFGKQFFYALPALLSMGVDEFIYDFYIMQDIRLEGETIPVIVLILKEASLGVASLSAVIDHFIGKDSYLWFRDYWLLPQHIIPSKLLGIEKVMPPTVSAINTEIMQGRLVASTPPAILAMLLYNVGYIGVALMFFYGALGRLIQNKFSQMENSPERTLFFFYFVYLYGGFIGNGDIKVYVYSSFPLVILIFYLYTHKYFNQ